MNQWIFVWKIFHLFSFSIRQTQRYEISNTSAVCSLATCIYWYISGQHRDESSEIHSQPDERVIAFRTIASVTVLCEKICIYRNISNVLFHFHFYFSHFLSSSSYLSVSLTKCFVCIHCHVRYHHILSLDVFLTFSFPNGNLTPAHAALLCPSALQSDSTAPADGL